MLSRLSSTLYGAGTLLIGALVLRGPLGLTVSDLFFAAAIVIAVANETSRKRRITIGATRTALLGAALFSVGGLIASAFSSHRASSFGALVRLDYVMVIWVWFAPVVVQSTSMVVTQMRLWSISAAATAVFALIQLGTGLFIPSGATGSGRMTGLTQDVTDLGGVTAIALVPSWMFVIAPRISALKRALAGSVAGLVSIGLVLSGSVTGLIAAATAIVVWTVLLRRWKELAAIAAVLVLAVAATSGVQLLRHAQPPVVRVAEVLGIGGPDRRPFTATYWTRLSTDMAAVNSILRNPFVGAGLDNASAEDRLHSLVHNIYLEAGVGAGALGLVGVVLLTFAPLDGEIRRLLRDPTTATLTAPLLGSAAAFLAFGLAAPILLARYAWFPLAMLVALRYATRPPGDPPSAKVGHQGNNEEADRQHGGAGREL